jgi:molybdenum cofactor biosynthesis protein B
MADHAPDVDAGGDGTAEREHEDSGDHDRHDHEHEHHHDHEHEHHHDHHHHHDLDELGVAILTVSSSRTLDDDPAGDAIAATVEADGHAVVTRELVPDDYDRVQDTVNRFVDREDTDCVVTAGGTGVTPDDVTLEAVEPLFEKELPGFGELFRQLSFDEIGTKVVCTRAAAGIADEVPVFCLPGSENAARLGTEEIVVEQAGHLAGLARRDDET